MSLWYVKFHPPHNQDLSTALEKELLNKYFEICYSKLKKWAVKERP